MTYYNKRTIFGNRYCQHHLNEFRNDIIEYFNNVQYDRYERGNIENESAIQVRSIINQKVPLAHKLISATGIDTKILYSPPPMIGGYRQNIDVLANIFNLRTYSISPVTVLDLVDRAIGVYVHDETSSLIRTLNPLFWLGELLDFIISLPFRLLRRAGIPTQKIEESYFVKIAKVMLYIVSLLAGLEQLGWIKVISSFLTSLELF